MNGDFKELSEILKKSKFEEEEDFAADIEAFLLKEEYGIETEINSEKEYSGININLEYDPIKEGEKVPFSLDLVKKYLNEIKKYKPEVKFNFKISYVLNQDFIVDTKDCKTLEQVDNYLRDTKDTELMIAGKDNSFHLYGFRKTLNANRKLDSVAEKIKNAKNNGEPLSPFEKFMVAYEYVTNYAYNEAGDVLHKETSHWIPVLEGDKIVCAGYASLLEALCDRIFSPNEVKVFNQGLRVFDRNTKEFLGGHGNNTVFIKDDKYGIDGLFYSDSCWDSINDSRKGKPQAYCCIPLKDLLQSKKNLFIFDDNFSMLYLNKYKEYTDFKETYENSEIDDFDDIARMGKKDYADIVEKYFMGYKKNGKEQNYFKEHLGDIILYDTFKQMSEEDKETLRKMEEVYPQRIKEKYKEILSKYKGLEIPSYLHEDVKKYCHVDEFFKLLDSENVSEKDILENIEKVAKAFQEEKVRDYVRRWKEMGYETSSFDSFVISTTSHAICHKKTNEFIHKYKKFIENSKKKNADITRNKLDEKAESTVVPIEAFINSYKIIGAQQGLRGEELNEYVKNRIQLSIERTNNNFEVERCSNCFAKQKTLKRG